MRWEGRRRAVRTERQSVLAAPAGACGRKMAELRALVAVKRVIDFAVKVTGTPSHLPGPFGRVLLGPRARKCLGVFSYPDFCRSYPKRQSHLRAKFKGRLWYQIPLHSNLTLLGSRPRSLSPSSRLTVLIIVCRASYGLYFLPAGGVTVPV